MSYRGKPSRGCKRCVSKKVKCDQEHPVCQRCQKAGVQCEYRDLFELVHRSQTQAAERTAKEKWRQRATKSSSSSSDEASPRSSGTSPDSPSPKVPAKLIANCNSLVSEVSLRPSLQQLAYFRFVFDFVGSDDQDYTTAGAFQAMPHMYSAASPNSPLHHAVTAVSLANFGGRFKSMEATQQGAIAYGKALTTFAAAMTGPREKLSTNEALLGIFLLGTYEVMTSTAFDGTFKMHQHGATSILRARFGDGTLNDGYRQRFITIIYTQLVMTSLIEGTAPPEFDPDWQLFPKGNPRGKLIQLLHQAAVLRHEIEQQCDSPVSSPHSVFHSEIRVDPLINDILELDSRLEEWYEQTCVDMNWLAAKEPVDVHAAQRPQWAKQLFSLPGAPKEMHAYRSVMGALAANLYRTGRLWINMTALRHLSMAAADPTITSDEEVYYRSMIESTAAVIMELIEGVCLSVPCLLGVKVYGQANDPSSPDEIYGYKGLIILWPLVSATVAFALPSMQRQDKSFRRAWIWCVLTFLRNQLGLAKAEAYRAYTTVQLDTDSLRTMDITQIPPERKMQFTRSWWPDVTSVH